MGEATPGSETVVCASGNTLGGGLAFAGNVTDGAAGRNAKIWRMNAAGNVLWNKTINNAAPGNFESCSDILFDESNGDVYAFGTTADNIFISRYQSTTGSSGYIKLDDIKGEKVKGETSFGDVVCSILSNDGLIAVDETRLDTASDSIALNVSHSGMLVSRACAGQIASFLRTANYSDPRLWL